MRPAVSTVTLRGLHRIANLRAAAAALEHGSAQGRRPGRPRLPARIALALRKSARLASCFLRAACGHGLVQSLSPARGYLIGYLTGGGPQSDRLRPPNCKLPSPLYRLGQPSALATCLCISHAYKGPCPALFLFTSSPIRR